MAMSKCKECGKSISTLAKTCPGCGAPNPTGKTSPSKSKKEENYKPKGLIQILAAIGLVIAILWTAKGLFQAGSAGYKQVKKSTSSISKTNYKFTCEGNAKTNYGGMGLGPEHNTDELFIDEYNLKKEQDKTYTLTLTSNLRIQRPSQIIGANSGDLTVTNSTIRFDPSETFLKLVTGTKDIKVKRFNGSISLNSANYSSSLITYYKGDPILIDFSGRCFGLEQIKNFIK
jgi:hypothetical protein